MGNRAHYVYADDDDDGYGSGYGDCVGDDYVNDWLCVIMVMMMSSSTSLQCHHQHGSFTSS